MHAPLVIDSIYLFFFFLLPAEPEVRPVPATWSSDHFSPGKSCLQIFYFQKRGAGAVKAPKLAAMFGRIKVIKCPLAKIFSHLEIHNNSVGILFA